MAMKRRVFLHRLTFLGGGVVLLSTCKDDKPPAPPKGGIKPKGLTVSAKHKTFTDQEWPILLAACDRILPRDQDPGAVDADVPEYIDRMLQTPELWRYRENLVNGLQRLDQSGAKPFTELDDAAKDAVLAKFRDAAPGSPESKVYELLLFFTLEGFLGDPSYGGNKDRAGWKLVGFELVGHEAASPAPGYDGTKALHHHHGG
jgi:gluconate 2-dehydrogenase gamma chain